MKLTKLLAIALGGLMLTSCTATSQADRKPNGMTDVQTSETLKIEKVANLSEDFIFGMDSSCVPSLEASGVKYYDHDGTEKDVFEILSENGINYIRVRVWNAPFDASGNGYGGGNCDIENAIEIGKRATKYGMKLLVNFHYSDFWADPSKQMVPKAWADMDISQKAEALYVYTEDCLEKLVSAGVDVGMVQIGNETTSGMSGEHDWKNITSLMSAGSRAVREVCPKALVAIHFTNPERSGSYDFYAKTLADNNVDYDVFASSYYPYWHGSLENLAAVLNKVSADYNKKTMIAETSYAYTSQDTDCHGNTVKDGDYSEQIQADHIRSMIDTAANKLDNCLGVFYWEGTWISVGGSSWEENSALWEKYGSGWASSHAGEYDPKDAGQWYGGSAVDNQALFDKNGRALESLKTFALVR